MAVKELRGNRVVVNGGDYQIGVQVQYTADAIVFKPFVAVWTKFNATQSVAVSWVRANNKTKTYKTNVLNRGDYFKFPNNKFQPNSDYQLTIKAVIGGKTSSVTVTNTSKPKKPAVTASRVNDNNISVVATAKKTGKAVTVTTVEIQRQIDIKTANWEDFKRTTVNTTGDYTVRYSDYTTAKGHRYRYRARANSAASNSGWAISAWIATAPNDIQELTHERLDNKSCCVAIRRDYEDVTKGVLTGFIVERSESGGIWQVVNDSMGVGSDLDDTVTWTDTSCTEDNYYSYRARPYNATVKSLVEAPSESGTDPTYNTPAAPISISATWTANATALLTLDNQSKTADVLEIQRTTDGITWTNVDTVDQSVQLCTEYEDTTAPSSTTLYYRVRNGRSEMALVERFSAWLESNIILTLSKPNPPTLIRPYDGTPKTYADSPTRLSWIHNPTDGTEQEAAIIRYTLDGGKTYTTINVGAISYYDLPITSEVFNVGAICEWSVSTKGAYSEYSDFSAVNTFKVIAQPTLTFTSPSNGGVIANLPLDIAWTYGDASGTLEQLTLNIIQGNTVVDSRSIDVGDGQAGSYSYSLAGFLFENNTGYLLQAIALSSSGLTAVDEIGINIEYVPVQLTGELLPDIELNEDDGYAIITISEALSDGEGEVIGDQIIVNSTVREAYLYRLYNGQRVLLGEVSVGDQITDRYCPLNALFTYELLQIAETGEISYVQMDTTLLSDNWYVYWGDNIARARWNATGGIKISRPEKVQIRYSGREYPVTYDSLAISETISFTATVTDKAEVDEFVKLMRDGGAGVWKSCDGDVYMADFSFSYNAQYSHNQLVYAVKLDVTRVESEAL